MTARSAPPSFGPRLPRSFYDRPVERVARELVGRVLVSTALRTVVAGRILEVEAYGAERDAASHAFRGRTARNATMFGPPGRLYIYRSHGLHPCINVVTGPVGSACAVLIRALEPLAGLAVMRRRRPGRDDRLLARGPGCVARAMGLTWEDDGIDLVAGRLWISRAVLRDANDRVCSGPRVGIRRAVERRWRFFLAGHPGVSAFRRG